MPLTSVHAQRIQKYYDDCSATYDERAHAWFTRPQESRAVLSLLPDLEGKIVADLCAGTGFYSRQLLQMRPKRLIAVDFSQGMLQRIREPGILRIEADVGRWSCREKIDVFLCAGGLEFVEDPGQVFRCARRMARQESRFVGLVPSRGFFSRCYQGFHRLRGIRIRLFDCAILEGYARTAGWGLQTYTPAHPYADVFQLIAMP